MSVNLIQYAFVAGEISPRLFGRTDLEKYDLGVALAHNYFVDYRGGISTRPGTRFLDFIQNDDKETKFFEFAFAPDAGNTYGILFGEGYIRFVQNDGYVLEDSVIISAISQANPGVMTANAHGYTAGDWIKPADVVGMTELNGRTLQAGAVTTNTIVLLDAFGNGVDTTGFTTYVSDGAVSRVYTVASPYATTDLSKLRANQLFDEIRFTHDGYEVRVLKRIDHTNWTLTLEDFGNDETAPTNVSLTESASGSAGVAVAVTAVHYETGIESLASRTEFETTMVDYTVTAGSLKITWDAVTGAKFYNIYRSLILGDGTDIHYGNQLGFIGRSFGPQFTDNNIIPDFVGGPPEYADPFVDSEVTRIEVTAGGSAYVRSATVDITDATGTGAVAYPVVAGGKIIAVIIERGGSGYTAPTIGFSGAGSGATATATVGLASGNNPALVARYQQRQIYAATINKPLTVFGSRPGQLTNFGVTQIITADDSYEFDLDTGEVTPIRHMLVTRGGLLLMSQKGVWQLNGGDGRSAITPIQALAEPQSYTGTDEVEPLQIEADVLYVEGKGTTVRLLTYNDFAKVYSGTDMSILSNHMLLGDKRIVRWDFAAHPFKLVHSIRNDGGMLAFTLVREQNVYAWTQYKTKGLYQDILTVQEGKTDATYLVVKRKINGRWTKFIEKQASREFDHVERAWAVDCGLGLPQVFPVATLTPAVASGDGVTFTTNLSVFAPGDVGKIIRAGGGKGTVATYVSGQEITVDLVRAITKIVPEDDDNTPLEIESGDWTLDTLATIMSGLGHLEGESVAILSDGNVEAEKVVTNGSITLEAPATCVTIGLPYQCVAQTLPLTATDEIIEGKRKRVVGSSVRVADTRGLKSGAQLDKLYEMRDRTTEVYGEPTVLQNKTETILIEARFDKQGQTFYVQDYPLPATILGLVYDLEIGDDSD